jgi:hypothetical protein
MNYVTDFIKYIENNKEMLKRLTLAAAKMDDDPEARIVEEHLDKAVLAIAFTSMEDAMKRFMNFHLALQASGKSGRDWEWFHNTWTTALKSAELYDDMREFVNASNDKH